MNSLTDNIYNALRHSFLIGAGAFFLAVLATFTSKYLLDNITSLIISLLLLLMIIIVGIIFDIIGVAAAAASEPPLHAKNAKKILGAPQAIQMVRKADKVSSFCNDVVGDVSGTLSGAIGAAIVFRILVYTPTFSEVVVSTFTTSLIAALIVAGKAFGKAFAIKKSTEIVFQVGRLLAWLEKSFAIKLISADTKKGRRT